MVKGQKPTQDCLFGEEYFSPKNAFVEIFIDLKSARYNYRFMTISSNHSELEPIWVPNGFSRKNEWIFTSLRTRGLQDLSLFITHNNRRGIKIHEANG